MSVAFTERIILDLTQLHIIIVEIVQTRYSLWAGGKKGDLKQRDIDLQTERKLTKDEASDRGSYKAASTQQERVVQVEGLGLAGLHDECCHRAEETHDDGLTLKSPAIVLVHGSIK